MSDADDAVFLGKASDGRLIRRPLSPHIGIYHWPLSMVGSILNRATGIAISIGTLLLVWWLVAAAAGPVAFAGVQAFIASPIGLLLLLGWTLSLFFHLFSGIRHLGWDIGIGTAKRSLNPGALAIFALTLGATAAVWIAGYAVFGG